jgi:hypothetical protein
MTSSVTNQGRDEILLHMSQLRNYWLKHWEAMSQWQEKPNRSNRNGIQSPCCSLMHLQPAPLQSGLPPPTNLPFWAVDCPTCPPPCTWLPNQHSGNADKALKSSDPGFFYSVHVQSQRFPFVLSWL